MEPNELEGAIQEELALNPEIKSWIDVQVSGTAVRLSGIVGSPEEKNLAVECAIKLGATAVENDISLESGRANSRTLGKAVERSLEDEEIASVAGVEKIIDGVVYLSGHAESAEIAERAIHAAAKTPGVRDVVSDITLPPGLGPDEVTIANRVEQAMVDAGLRAENITITVEDGSVYLDGIAWKKGGRERAERAAKSVHGVRGVVNHLRSPAEPMSGDESAAWEVLKRLERATINVINLNVTVASGTAFLDGSVDTEAQRESAASIALGTPGIQRIKNDLAVAA